MKIECFTRDPTASFGLHKAGGPVFFGSILILIRIQEQLLSLCGRYEHLCGKRRQLFVFFFTYICKYIREAGTFYVFDRTVYLKAVSLKGEPVLIEAKLQDNALFRIILSPLVIRVEYEIAERIKNIARENRIMIVENKPLARALYAAVEVGGSVPQELYQAVAELLAYVYKLKNKKIRPSNAA